jgi:prepilin-type N-terminal cleavage/methylation domain-containing protein
MKQRGFTITELVISMAVLVLLVSLASVNLIHFNQRASLNSTVTSLISDIKEQQTKAMVGDTEGASSPTSYGVYFEATKYTLFKGSSYVVGDSHNFSINLPTNDTIQSPGYSIVFTRLSGETSGTTTITIIDLTNHDQKVITLNSYGVVTTVN